MSVTINKSKLSEVLLSASQDWVLKPVDFRVYAYLCCRCVQEDLVYNDISAQEVAEAVNLSKSTVSRALRHLTMHSFIEAHNDKGKRGRYSVVGLTGFLNQESKKRQQQLDDFLGV